MIKKISRGVVLIVFALIFQLVAYKLGFGKHIIGLSAFVIGLAIHQMDKPLFN